MAEDFEEKTQRIVGNLGNALTTAFSILHKCLLNNGAIKPGQFAEALKGTFNYPDADWERFDYVVLPLLAKEIERAEREDRIG
jgi:hypothetical protein